MELSYSISVSRRGLKKACSTRTKARMALLGIISGGSMGAFGLVIVPGLSMLAWWLNDARLQRVSSWIGYGTLPMLLLGGWCLDWYERLTNKKS